MVGVHGIIYRDVEAEKDMAYNPGVLENNLPFCFALDLGDTVDLDQLPTQNKSVILTNLLLDNFNTRPRLLVPHELINSRKDSPYVSITQSPAPEMKKLHNGLLVNFKKGFIFGLFQGVPKELKNTLCKDIFDILNLNGDNEDINNQLVILFFYILSNSILSSEILLQKRLITRQNIQQNSPHDDVTNYGDLDLKDRMENWQSSLSSSLESTFELKEEVTEPAPKLEELLTNLKNSKPDTYIRLNLIANELVKVLENRTS